MKAAFFALVTVLLLHTASVSAVPAAASPLAGRWSIDVAKLPMPPEARPKSVLLEFQTAPAGKWAVHVEIVDPNGGTMHAEATLPLDGTPVPVSGNYWADVTAAKMPAPNVLVMQLADHGTPSSTRIYSVSADGNTLTETKAFFGKDGNPILQTNLFNRAP